MCSNAVSPVKRGSRTRWAGSGGRSDRRQRDDHGIPAAVACRAVGVSRSWFYKHQGGTLPPRAARRKGYVYGTVLVDMAHRRRNRSAAGPGGRQLRGVAEGASRRKSLTVSRRKIRGRVIRAGCPRRTGVKMAVVPLVTPSLLGPAKTVTESGAGTGILKGRSVLLRARGSALSASPPVPGRYPSRRYPHGAGKEADTVEEVTDEPLYRDQVCGIDIGKAGISATIRVQSDKNPSRRMQETRAFGTTKRQVLAPADWLRSWQVPAVVMEATGDYWKPVFYRLEAEGLECVLADARQVKNLPGRPKRDTSDSQWLAQNFERGAVRPCFVATPEFRVIRLHTRYRRDLIQERTREKQRVEKLLESAGIKLSGVLADLHGVSGRDIMDHLVAGERNPRDMAQLASRRARAKIPRLDQ